MKYKCIICNGHGDILCYQEEQIQADWDDNNTLNTYYAECPLCENKGYLEYNILNMQQTTFNRLSDKKYLK